MTAILTLIRIRWLERRSARLFRRLEAHMDAHGCRLVPCAARQRLQDDLVATVDRVIALDSTL